MRRWWRKVRARRPGIYAYRTWRHHRPTAAEWGYVGLSNRLDLRDGQHKLKPWYDLKVRRYVLVRLPWWLGWHWVLAPLETLFILLLLPRYNDAKNPRPGKVRKVQQGMERAERAVRGHAFHAKVEITRWAYLGARLAGAALILAGLGGWWITR